MTISTYLGQQVPFFGLPGRIHRAGGVDAVARLVGAGPAEVFLCATPFRSPAVAARVDAALPPAGTKPRWAVWARTALAAGILLSIAALPFI